MSTYSTVWTNIGRAKLANAIAQKKTLKFAKMCLGDGNGVLPTPKEDQIALVREVFRGDLNQVFVDPANANMVVGEMVVASQQGGFWVREGGLIDEDGDLCVVANCPESYKPKLDQGSVKDQVVRLATIVSNTANIEIKIDPAIVLATRKYADDAVLAFAAPKIHKHDDLAPKESPVLTGKPTAPTAGEGAKDAQIANAEFVATAIVKAMANSIPYLNSIPAQKITDAVLMKGIGMMEWIEVAGVGAFSGYRSLRCGAIEFGTTAAPRSYEADLVGGLGSKVNQASIWAWAQQQGHSVAAASWSTKVFKFADVDANTFRFPDMRDVFPRFTGTDFDTGAARALGSYKGDTLKDHTHGLLFATGGSGGTDVVPYGTPGTQAIGTRAITGVVSGGVGVETAPKHTAFHPRIHI